MKQLESLLNQRLTKYSKDVGFDLNYFVKQGFWTTTTYFTNGLKSFLLSILFANFISKELFGQYSFIISLLGITSIFVFPGLKTGIINGISKNKDGTYFLGLKQTFYRSFLGSLFLVATAIYSFITGHTYGYVLLLGIAAVYPLYSVSGMYTSILIGKQKFKLKAKIVSIFNLISLVILATGILLNLNLTWLIFLSILPNIAYNSYFSTFYIKRILKNKEVDYKNLDFGKKISFSFAISNLANRLDELLVGVLLGFTELAIFKIVTLFPNQIKQMLNPISDLILPKLNAQKIQKKDLKRQFKKVFFITLITILGYTLIAQSLFNIFYSAYSDYAWLSILYHLSFVVFMHILPYNYLLKQRKTKEINKLMIISSTILITLSVICIPLWGLVGAIIARITYRLCYVSLSFYYFNKAKIN